MKLRRDGYRRSRHSFSTVAIWTAGAVFVGLILMLASIPWIAQVPPGANAGGAADVISFEASAIVGASGALTVFIAVPTGHSGLGPDVDVFMPAHRMSVPVEILSAGPGAYQARAILPMPGAWEVRIRFADESSLIEVQW